MHDKHEFQILCRRVGEIPDPPPDRKAERDVCAKCGHAIWVGPHSRQRQRELAAKLFCSHCSVAHMQGQPHVVYGSQNQIAELSKSLGDDGMFFPLGIAEDHVVDDAMRKLKDKQDYGPNSKN